MSKWTNVNASIRFAGTNDMLPTKQELGRMCKSTDKSFAHWQQPNLPCGTEGSIRYRILNKIHHSTDGGCIVVFWGALRDYTNTTEILEYFTRIAANRIVLSGILEIDCNQTVTNYRYDNEFKKWVQLK